MKDVDPDNSFEAELRVLRPAQPDPENVRQLRAMLPNRRAARPELRTVSFRFSIWRLLRWLLPMGFAAAACAALLAGYWRHFQGGSRLAPVASASPALKADHIEIDRQLVTNFDAVASLPSGEPVRFRCEQWMDKVRIRDSSAGLVLEHTTPRLEIMPVKLEIY